MIGLDGAGGPLPTARAEPAEPTPLLGAPQRPLGDAPMCARQTGVGVIVGVLCIGMICKLAVLMTLSLATASLWPGLEYI